MTFFLPMSFAGKEVCQTFISCHHASHITGDGMDNHKKRTLIAYYGGLALSLISSTAAAHVKWFAETDAAETPKPIGEVLTQPAFVGLFLLSVLCIYTFFLIDRWALRKGVLATLDTRMKSFDGFSIHVMRISGAIFFLSLAAWYWLHGSGFYITPELKTSEAWVPWLHLVMGLCALSRRTAFITGLGIALLYAFSIEHYGVYHLIDYMIFLGIGYFFMTSASNNAKWRKSAFIVLFASTGLTLTWAAIEKFAYPQWTFAMLEANPGMLMGMDALTYMTLAGFVEFNITFILLGAASMIGRLVALGLQSVFVLAIFKFGIVDAIGHLMIIAILFVLFVRGPTDARNMLVLRDKSLFTEAYFMTGLYYLAIVSMFFAYYGLHILYYGH
jgi:hypothetical protein